MSDPRFSIVTITLNDLVGLAETHSSVAAQECTDFEWLVIDGGSADGTVDYLRRIQYPYCDWTSEPDSGLYDAMNKGLTRATGQYVIFMNSGDRFAQANVLARVTDELDRGGRGGSLLFGDSFEETVKGTLLLKKARPADTIRYGMFTHHQAMIYERRAIHEMRYNSRYMVAADYDFTCRLLIRGGTSQRLKFPISINKRAGLSEKHADIGRRENLAVQKAVLQLGVFRRIANFTIFLGASLMRTRARGLYDWLRFRQSVGLDDVT